MEQKDFRKELAETARAICTPGHGILAADESTGTIGKKFAGYNIENTEDNRRAYRELLFTTEGLNKYISGVILFDETARQSSSKGVKFLDLLKEQNIVAGIKVDQGMQVLPGNKHGEAATMGLDTLAARAAEYYGMGIRFAKWRSVLKIDLANNLPSNQAVHEVAWGLARYASICQANGLVPIVEPEILSDGPHSIEECQKVMERVNAEVFKCLNDNNVFLEGCLLKPNMVLPGSTHPDRSKITPQEIGFRTAAALSRVVPPALVGVTFLSGGQSEEEASLNLNAMNQLKELRRPWFLTFSYGRALQNSCVKAWGGKAENVQVAQQALLARAKANSEAQLGTFTGSNDDSAKESLFISDYKY